MRGRIPAVTRAGKRMQPPLTERFARLRELCAALDAARPDDFAAITLHAEALSHEAGLVAADAAEAARLRGLDRRGRRGRRPPTRPPVPRRPRSRGRDLLAGGDPRAAA